MFTSVIGMYSLRQKITKDIIRRITTKSNIQRSTLLGIHLQKWGTLNSLSSIRTLNTLEDNIVPEKSERILISKDESREFMAIFPDIVRDLTDAGRHTDIPEVTKWFTKVLQHNVPNGKKMRGLSVVGAYKMLDPRSLSSENVRLANIMGWCVEMLEAMLVIVDDIMDYSETRRGIPCWYKDVGLSAINDGILIENGIYSLLRRYFSSLPIYIPCIELFHDITLKTSMGQALDNLSTIQGKQNLNAFSMNRYNSIVKYKTAYYSCHLPVALGLYLANKFDPEVHRQAKTIMLEMGHFFQIQNDFFDCFGDVSRTGKIGTDIQQGKCSWLVVVALQRATTTQKRILQDNYGKSNPEAVLAIKNLYEELGLPNTYAIYEEENLKLIKTHIEQISKGLPHELFFKLLNMNRRFG